MNPPSGPTRRSFLKAASAGALTLSPLTSRLMIAAPKRKSTDIRIKEIEFSYDAVAIA
jgi:hypothetical protein